MSPPWDDQKIQNALLAITDVHQHLEDHISSPGSLSTFEPWKAKPLYDKFAAIIAKQYEEPNWEAAVARLPAFVSELEKDRELLKQLPANIIHNDFNPRNVAIRKDGSICIYDWELAMMGIPHRDVVELLSFVLEENFSPARLFRFLTFHHGCYQQLEIPRDMWLQGYIYGLQEFLATRATFYLAGSILMNYDFAERIFLNAFRMLELIESELANTLQPADENAVGTAPQKALRPND